VDLVPAFLAVQLRYLLGEAVDVCFAHCRAAHVDVLDYHDVVDGVHALYVLRDYCQDLVY
jgi:hypothetical protein